MRILRAGSTRTSHSLSSRFSSRSRNISMSAPVFSSKYSIMSLKMRCSISPVLRSTTIRRASSRFSAGYFAIISCENS